MSGSIASRTRSRLAKLVQRLTQATPSSPPPPTREDRRWIAATATGSRIKRDEATDVFRELKRKATATALPSAVAISPNAGLAPDTPLLCVKGNEFETSVIAHIRKNLGNVVTIDNRITDDSCAMAEMLIRNRQYPFLHSVPLRDHEFKCHGLADLLVLSTHLHTLSAEPVQMEEFAEPRYVVVDVKMMILALMTNGWQISNAGLYPSYKSQLDVYNRALAAIQGTPNRYAYLLGRGHRIRSVTKFGAFDRLGCVDLTGVDQGVLAKTDDAVKWLREIESKSAEELQRAIPVKRRRIRDPVVDQKLLHEGQVFPNLGVGQGWYGWGQKVELAREISDITEVWGCGTTHQARAHQAGVYSWQDKRCTAELLGFKGAKAMIVDRMLAANRDSFKGVMLPQSFDREEAHVYDWIHPTNEVYVDFETFVDIPTGIPSCTTRDTCPSIFMIGAWHSGPSSGGLGDPSSGGPSGGWQYTCFEAKDDSLDEELRIMTQFNEFIKGLGNPRVWYWYAESQVWNKRSNEQVDRLTRAGLQSGSETIVKEWGVIQWTDMLNVFKTEPIAIKGCMTMSLKDVARAMATHGLIQTRLDGNAQVTNGFDAAIMAKRVLEMSPEHHRPGSSDIMQSVRCYNEFDVKVLHEIMEALRARVE